MALFEWRNIYSVGHDELDAQHQKLFDIGNRFHDALTNGKHQIELHAIFMELIRYTQLHFATEEAYLREIRYPDYARHKENHDKLVKLVSNYAEQFEKKEAGVEQRAMNFIKTWLDGHILGMDRNYRTTEVIVASQIAQASMNGSTA